MPDETINIRYQVTTEGDKEAIKRAKELRQAIDEVKKSLVTVAQASGTRYKESAQALIEVKRTQEMAKVPMIGQGEFAKKDEVALAQAEKNISEYVKLMSQAQSEVTSETASAVQARGILNANEHKEAIALAKQTAATVKAAEKEKTTAKSIATKEAMALQKEYSKQVIAAVIQQARDEATAERAKGKEGITAPGDIAVKARQQATQASQAYKAALASEKQATNDAVIAAQKYKTTLSEEDKAALQTANNIKNMASVHTQAAKQIASDADKEAKAAENAVKRSTQAATAFAKVGDVLRNAFSFFIGGSVFAAVYKLINGFQELIKTGEDYAQTIYRLGVSINQLQRRGLDITIQSEIALIKELQAQYSTFSKKGVIEATTSVQMLTRNFGFNQEQIKKTIQLSMDLALVQGKDVGETAKQLALFYSSGYGEGLQHAGLAVNRLTVMQEAHRMGIKKSYMQLTELERASAAYNLVTRQSADLHNDAAKIQDSMIGQIKEQKSAIENVTNEIALRALPIELAWLKVKVAMIKVLGDQINAFDAQGEAVEEVMKKYDPGKMWDELTYGEKRQYQKPFLGMGGKYWDEVNKLTQEKIKKMKEEWEDILGEGMDVKTGGIDLIGADEESSDAREKLGEEIRKWLDDLEQAEEEHNAKEQELAKENADNLVEITKEAGEERVKAWADYADKIDDIEKDLAQEIADAQLDAVRKQEDLDREYNLSVQDANRKYHENELKAERDFQERMKRLREEFLFDLEDALRARDAIQVLRLIRRYNLDREQETRNFTEQQADAAREHQIELQELARQHAEEERQNQEALAREIEDAKAAAEQKLEDAKAAWIEESNAIDEKEAERLEKEKSAYIVRQLELDKDLQETKDKINKSFGEWLATEGYSLDQMHQILMLYMGKDGALPALFNNYLAVVDASAIQFSNDMLKMQAALDAYVADAQKQATVLNSLNLPGGLGAMQQANQMPQTQQPYYPSSEPKGSTYEPPAGSDLEDWLKDLDEWLKGGYKFARGGTLIATKPTTAIFGESGPELAEFTPLSQLKTNPANPNANLGGINGKGGIAKIELWLSPDLEARIVDNTLGQAAEIVTEMGRAR